MPNQPRSPSSGGSPSGSGGSPGGSGGSPGGSGGSPGGYAGCGTPTRYGRSLNRG